MTNAMTNATTPRHDTKNPLTCCPRCYKAELLGRAMRSPIFRYDKVDADERPLSYAVYHGAQHVATLSRRGASGPTAYEVRVVAPGGEQELAAGSLRDARALAEETYTVSWREGAQAARGPVKEL
jgi:hypothetical protein